MSLSRREERNSNHPMIMIEDDNLNIEVYSEGTRKQLSLDEEIQILQKCPKGTNPLIERALDKRLNQKYDEENNNISFYESEFLSDQLIDDPEFYYNQY